MKIKIANMNYVYGTEGGGRLVRFSWPDLKPWVVFNAGGQRRFPTHAEAIRYADELARGLREVS